MGLRGSGCEISVVFAHLLPGLRKTGRFVLWLLENLIFQVDEYEVEVGYGLICEGKEGRSKIQAPLDTITVTQEGENKQHIEDYSVWFANYRRPTIYFNYGCSVCVKKLEFQQIQKFISLSVILRILILPLSNRVFLFHLVGIIVVVL